MWRLLKSYNSPLYYVGQVHNPLLQALLEYVITAGFLVCSQFIKCSFSVYSAAGGIDSLLSQNHGKSQLSSTALPLGWWEMTDCAYAGTCLLNLRCHKNLTIEAGCFLTCPQHILCIYVKKRSHDFDVLLSHNILASTKEALWDAQSCQGELNWGSTSTYLCILLLAAHCFPLLNCGICGLHGAHFYLVFCLWLYPSFVRIF